MNRAIWTSALFFSLIFVVYYAVTFLSDVQMPSHEMNKYEGELVSLDLERKYDASFMAIMPRNTLYIGTIKDGKLQAPPGKYHYVVSPADRVWTVEYPKPPEVTAQTTRLINPPFYSILTVTNKGTKYEFEPSFVDTNNTPVALASRAKKHIRIFDAKNDQTLYKVPLEYG